MLASISKQQTQPHLSVPSSSALSEHQLLRSRRNLGIALHGVRNKILVQCFVFYGFFAVSDRFIGAPPLNFRPYDYTGG